MCLVTKARVLENVISFVKCYHGECFTNLYGGLKQGTYSGKTHAAHNKDDTLQRARCYCLFV